MYEYRPVPKPSFGKVDKPKKIDHKRSDKLTQKQMGAITPKVRKQVRERSQGLCEVRIKCNGAPAVEQAHLTSRGTIKHRTTAADLRDSCKACHTYLDTTAEGIKYKRALRGA